MSITHEQIKAEWEKADKDGSGSLTFKEVSSLLHRFNLKLKDKEVKKKFQEVDKDGNKNLDFEEFVDFLERLRIRPEIEEIFQKFADPKTNSMNADHLVKFLQTVQKEPTALASSARAKELIQEFEKHPSKSEKNGELSVKGFSSLMNSIQFNSIFNPKNETVFQDMSQPFAHYYVASSHNTYLMGDQLKGESSPEAYINAFKKGCRCVELDCWDNEKDKSMPIIYHGHTLTSKITFQEVVEVVRDYGFVSSPYPVILSLEVHCGIEGQQAMAVILKKVLGDANMLPSQPDQTGMLPPPEKLKNKVLLKGKMVSFSDDEVEEDEEEEEAPAPAQASTNDKKKKEGKEEKKEEKEEKKGKKAERKHESTAKELSELISLKAVKFPGFKEYKNKNKAWEMSSFSEGKIGKFLSKSALDYVEYNSRQISRIFPKGTRIDSSNYDPTPAWNCGAQIVALNYQTGSEPMWTNIGKFQDNGASGYLLKPEYMRTENITFNPESKVKVSKHLEITVISAFQLPKVAGKEEKEKGEVIDPYVKVSVNGLPSDRRSFKTKVVKNNGFNPVWKTEFKIPLCNIDLATITFIVSDADFVSSNDFIGQYSLPATCIREGYRVVPLKDKQGNVYEKASLFIHVKRT